MSKIIKLSDVKLDKLNPNKATEDSDFLLTKSMQKFGNRAAVVLDKNLAVLDGNKRVEKHGEIGIGDDVVVIKGDPSKQYAIQYDDIDLNTKDGQELKLLLNTTSKKSEFDNDIIHEIAEIYDVDVQECGVDIVMADEIVGDIEEDNFKIPEDVHTDIKNGDLFEIHHNGIIHRLHCGDSCNQNDVIKLLNGELADLIFTDPPYDLADNYSTNIFNSAKDDCHIFIMNSDRLLIDNVNNGIKWFRKFFSVDFRQARLVSNNQPMTRVDLIAEFCKGKTKFNNLHDGFSTLIECSKIHSDKVDINFGHKQAKRLELPAAFIKHYSNKGELVVDLFGGSGSTLVASDMLGRRCYIQEFEPKNCQIILDRMIKTFNDAKIIKM